MRGTIYALALPLSTLLYQFRKFIPSFLRSAARVVSGYAWGQPLLTRAVLLNQRSKTRVFETPAPANAKARRCQVAGLSRVMSSPTVKTFLPTLTPLLRTCSMNQFTALV